MKETLTEPNDTLAFLQSMKENDLTEAVLKPLYGKMGYVDVIVHGGPGEEGKDLIAFKKGGFGRMIVHVAQVKRLRSARNSATSVLWGKIVHQLGQARAKAIDCKDGQSRVPTEVAFITPYVIDVRLLKEQFEQVQLNNILIIDGAALYAEIKETWPSFMAEVADVGGKITAATRGALRNVELFESLKVADEVSFENIYSDLNFFVGRAETRELIGSRLEAGELPQTISFETWLGIKANLLEVEKLVGFELIRSQVERIELAHREQSRQHLAADNKALGVHLQMARSKIVELDAGFDTTVDALRRQIEDADIGHEASESTAALLLLPGKLRNNDSKALNDQSISALESVIRHAKSTFPSLYGDRIDAVRDALYKLAEAHGQRVKFEAAYVPVPLVNFSLDTTRLCAHVNASIQWLRAVVEKINATPRARFDLKDFLQRVELLLSVVNRLVHTRTFCQDVFRLKVERQHRNRFSISAHDVFDTGMNVAVYGEAGAGKSTTLHMYVKRRAQLAGGPRKEALVFLPINRVMSVMAARGATVERYIGQAHFVKALLKCALVYVGGEPSERSVEEFVCWIRTRSRITFIIDGLDEAVTNNPWLLRAINAIPGEFANSQVVISSRDCISEINDIDFLGITLLPFTEGQLKRFVEGWSARGAELWTIIKARELMDVAKNPLLATIVCSLHDHGQPVPENEPEAYRKKIVLLCGEYDELKRVARTRSTREMLERTARAIAFGMHVRHVREIDPSGMKDILANTFRGTVAEETYSVAAEELVSPCGVLIRIPNTNRVGFGHLRYQEFLASEELIKNHRHSPLDYLHDSWWKGALYLYAFNADLEVLMENVYKLEKGFGRAGENILQMIEARPAHERHLLRQQLVTWKQQELRDEILLVEENYDENEWRYRDVDDE